METIDSIDAFIQAHRPKITAPLFYQTAQRLNSQRNNPLFLNPSEASFKSISSNVLKISTSLPIELSSVRLESLSGSSSLVKECVERLNTLGLDSAGHSPSTINAVQAAILRLLLEGSLYNQSDNQPFNRTEKRAAILNALTLSKTIKIKLSKEAVHNTTSKSDIQDAYSELLINNKAIPIIYEYIQFWLTGVADRMTIWESHVDLGLPRRLLLDGPKSRKTPAPYDTNLFTTTWNASMSRDLIIFPETVDGRHKIMYLGVTHIVKEGILPQITNVVERFNEEIIGVPVNV